MTDVIRASVLAAAIAVATPAMAFAETAPQTQGQARLPVEGEVRHGMGEIRDMVTAALPDISSGRLDAAGYARLADGISDRIQKMVSGSRLPAELKAELQTYMAELRQSAEHLREHGADAAGEVIASLEKYGRTFEHAGWPAKFTGEDRRSQ